MDSGLWGGRYGDGGLGESFEWEAPPHNVLLEHSDRGYEVTNTMIGIFLTTEKMRECVA